MDDNKNQNQPKTADYQKILDEYAASVKKEEESEPEEKELTHQEKPIENVPLKEADPEPSTPVESVIPEPTHTLTDDLEEEMTKTPPVPENKPTTAELKSINSPQLEAPIHPSLAANLEDEDDVETQPQPPVITPKPEIELTPEPTPQEEKPLTPQPETSLPENQEIPQIQKSPEEVKAEIEKILNDDSKNNSEPIETPVVAKKSGSPKTFFIFALVLFFLVIAAMAYFLFLAPANTSSSSSTATPTTIPTTSVVNDGSCDLNGSTYNVGESFDSADGCNTCNCVSAGVITCTEMACNLTPTTTTATRSVTTSSVSKDWKTYTDSTYKFSINYPSTWTINTKPSNNQVFSITSPEKIKLPKTYPEYDYLKIYFYKNYQSSLTDGKAIESYLSNKTDFLSFSKTKIANIDGYLGNENGMSSNPYPEYFIVRGNDLFEISSDDQDFSETEKQILNTLKFN